MTQNSEAEEPETPDFSNSDEITIDWNPGDGWLGERKVKVNWIEFPPMGEDFDWDPVLDPSSFGMLDDLKKENGEKG